MCTFNVKLLSSTYNKWDAEVFKTTYVCSKRKLFQTLSLPTSTNKRKKCSKDTLLILTFSIENIYPSLHTRTNISKMSNWSTIRHQQVYLPKQCEFKDMQCMGSLSEQNCYFKCVITTIIRRQSKGRSLQKSVKIDTISAKIACSLKHC